jgi:RNA recognition motif-containing protein
MAEFVYAQLAKRKGHVKMKLYVGNLSYTTTDEDLRTLFAQAGTVTSVEVIKDRFTGDSKGFAFVEMSSQSEGENAIRMFNGYSLDNREIKVNVARPRGALAASVNGAAAVSVDVVRAASAGATGVEVGVHAGINHVAFPGWR